MTEIETIEIIRQNIKTKHMAEDMFDGTTKEQRTAYREQFSALTKAIEALREYAEQRNPKPLTVEELRKMDGEAVYVQCGDGLESWAVIFWESPDVLFLYSPLFNPVLEPNLDFINMEHNDPNGHFGLHILGWRVLRHKPRNEE